MNGVRLQVKRLFRHYARNGVVMGLFLMLLIMSTSVSVMMAEHLRTADEVYARYYEETNLGDLFVEGPDGFTYDNDALLQACASTPATEGLAIASCETRLTLRGEYSLSDAQRSAVALARGCAEEDATCAANVGDRAVMVVHGMDLTDTGLGRINRLYALDNAAQAWGSQRPGEGEVVLDQQVRKEMGVELGDTVTLELNGSEYDFDVVGFAVQPDHAYWVSSPDVLVPTPGTLMVAYLDIDLLVGLTGLGEGTRNRLLVDVEGTPEWDLLDTPEVEGTDLQALREALATALREQNLSTVQVGDRSTQFGVELLRQDLEGAKTSQPVMVGMLVSVSALILAVSLERLVKRQRREIAVLRSLGTPSMTLLLAYLLPPVILGAVAAVIGIAIGTQLTEVFVRYYFGVIGSVPVVEVLHDPSVWIATFLAVMLIVVLFTLWPARSAVRLSPVEIDRREAGERPGPFVVWISRALPSSVALGARSIFRHPARLTVTVVGLGMAMILSSGFALLVNSMEVSFVDAQQADNWDYAVYHNPFDTTEVDAWLDADGGAYAVEWALSLPNGIPEGDTRTMTLEARTAFSSDGSTSMHNSTVIKGRLPVAGAGIPEAVVDEGSASMLGWSIGDRVSLHVGVTEIDVVLVGIVNEFQRSMWVHHVDVAPDLGMEDRYNVLYLNGGSDGAASPSEIPGVQVVDQSELRSSFANAWEQQSEIMSVFIGVGLLIAAIILLNTLVINLTEHDAEYATLRILGASTPRMAGILTVEHAIIGTLSAISGSVFSILAAEGMMAAFSTWSFHFTLDLEYLTVVKYGLVLIGAALMMTPVGLMRLRRMDLVERSKSFGQ